MGLRGCSCASVVRKRQRTVICPGVQHVARRPVFREALVVAVRPRPRLVSCCAFYLRNSVAIMPDALFHTCTRTGHLILHRADNSRGGEDPQARRHGAVRCVHACVRISFALYTSVGAKRRKISTRPVTRKNSQHRRRHHNPPPITTTTTTTTP